MNVEDQSSSMSVRSNKRKPVQVIGPLIVFILLFVALVSIDNIGFTISPSDYVNSVESIFQPTKTVPNDIPAQPADQIGLIDPNLYESFYLVQSDRQFSYLADLALRYKIKISINDVSDCKGGKACYFSTQGICNIANPGEVIISSELLEFSRTFMAGILVHELSHANNKLNNPYYCNNNAYLSNELISFKNQYTFTHQYDRIGIFDFFDSQGNLHEYPLYMNIKNTYSELADDVNLKPSSNIIETSLYSLYSG